MVLIYKNCINADEDSKKSWNIRLYGNTRYQDLYNIWSTLFSDHASTALYSYLPIFQNILVLFGES